VADPAAPRPKSLSGMRVVDTTKINLNTALMGNFAEAARIYVRQPPVVELAPLGGGTTQLISNQTLARCEEYLALAVPRPTSDMHHGPQPMPHYKVAEGRELSHSEPVDVLGPPSLSRHHSRLRGPDTSAGR
jgi:hypothetical protein